VHIAGISETAYGLTTPRCLDWQHESNRTGQARTGYRRHRAILALLAALACLAGCTAGQLKDIALRAGGTSSPGDFTLRDGLLPPGTTVWTSG
jgi:hypothetical protein